MIQSLTLDRFKPKYIKIDPKLLIWALIFFNVFYELISKYLFNLWELLPYLMIAIGLDLVTGLVKAKKKKQLILSKGLGRTVDKFIQYGSFLIVCHILANGNLFGTNQKYLGWLPETAIIYLILVELKSTLENISYSSKAVPTGIILNFIRKYLGGSRLNNDTNNTINK